MNKLLVFLKGFQLGLNYVITTLENNGKQKPEPRVVKEKEKVSAKRRYCLFPKDKEYLITDAANPRTDFRKRRLKYVIQELAPFSASALRLKLKREGYYIEGGIICKYKEN